MRVPYLELSIPLLHSDMMAQLSTPRVQPKPANHYSRYANCSGIQPIYVVLVQFHVLRFALALQLTMYRLNVKELLGVTHSTLMPHPSPSPCENLLSLPL